MKQNPYVRLAADISKALAADPYQSNWDLAIKFDVTEV
jgi:hypothetical protein